MLGKNIAYDLALTVANYYQYQYKMCVSAVDQKRWSVVDLVWVALSCPQFFSQQKCVGDL